MKDTTTNGAWLGRNSAIINLTTANDTPLMALRFMGNQTQCIKQSFAMLVEVSCDLNGKF